MAAKKQKRKVLWIDAVEKVNVSIGLEIGKDITQQQADELMAIIEDENEFDANSKEYGILNDYLQANIVDSDGYESVDMYIREEK